MCHSTKVHKLVYCHPYACCYIHPSSLWLRYFKTHHPRWNAHRYPCACGLSTIMFIGLSYINQHFLHHCLEWILDLFFGSCVKKCQQLATSPLNNLRPVNEAQTTYPHWVLPRRPTLFGGLVHIEENLWQVKSFRPNSRRPLWARSVQSLRDLVANKPTSGAGWIRFFGAVHLWGHYDRWEWALESSGAGGAGDAGRGGWNGAVETTSDFRWGKPESLYLCNSPGISSYRVQISPQQVNHNRTSRHTNIST
jgi:hypothetical protein